MFISSSSVGAEHYTNVGLQSSIHDADPHRLIQLLLEGLIQRVNVARLAMQRGDHALKGAQISKAIAILGGLKDGLDFEKGGELATNLDGLYGYMETRLFEANAKNELGYLDEVRSLASEIKDAWDQIPDRLGQG